MPTKSPKILVFVDTASFNPPPKGGGFGVAYMYYKEKLNRKDEDVFFLEKDKSVVSKRREFVKKLIPNSLLNTINFFRRRNALIKFLKKPPLEKPETDFSNYDIIYFHNTISIYRQYNNLLNYKGIVVLQSHSPEPLSWELYEQLPSQLRKSIRHLKERYEIIDKVAFERADYIVFPCYEASEPYQKWPYFNSIMQNKSTSFRYVLTGIPPAIAKRNREEVEKELQIPADSFIISYVGRHNKVKGYDILKEICNEYLSVNDNAYVISAGKEYPITRLEHPRWKEIGWTNDANSYITASDVFILPNRETYFDLVFLEVLSMGKIVIASYTGGNKYFEDKNLPGVLLYKSVPEAIELLQRVNGWTKEERLECGKKNKEFYEKYCCVESMYDSFKKTMNEIYSENG